MLQGKAKEKMGDMTGDKDMRAEGQTDDAKANVKQAGDNIKDAIN